MNIQIKTILGVEKFNSLAELAEFCIDGFDAESIKIKKSSNSNNLEVVYTDGSVVEIIDGNNFKPLILKEFLGVRGESGRKVFRNVK